VMFRPPEEASLPVLRKCEYGLDVIARLGELRMNDSKSMPEIHRLFIEKYDLRISERHACVIG